MHLLGAAKKPLLGASGLPRRVANRGVALACPASAACAAYATGMAALMLAVSGCGGQASVALPHRSAPPAVPAAVTGPVLTVRDQVVAAYTGYWQALGQALDTQNAGRARAILAQYVPGSGIGSLLSSFEADWTQGEIQYGSPVPHIMSVKVAGDHAAVHDCADFSNAGVQDARTGQVVGSLGGPHVNLISTLVLTRGRWLVSNQVPVELSCAP
jgi:hypothetical protein